MAVPLIWAEGKKKKAARRPSERRWFGGGCGATEGGGWKVWGEERGGEEREKTKVNKRWFLEKSTLIRTVPAVFRLSQKRKIGRKGKKRKGKDYGEKRRGLSEKSTICKLNP